MTNASTKDGSATHSRPGRVQGDPFAVISAIAGAEADARKRCEAFACAVADHFAAGVVSISVTVGGEQITHTEDDGSEHAESWRRVVEAELLPTQSLARGRARIYGGSDGQPSLALVAAPLTMTSGDAIGAVAMVIDCRDREVAREALVELRSLGAHLARVSVLPRVQTRDGARPEDLARVFSRAGEFRSLHHFAFAVTNTLASRLACEQVALGWVRGPRVRVLSVSGQDSVKQRNPGLHRIRQAMEECLDAGREIVAQRLDLWSEDEEPDRYRLHEAWRSAAAGASVASIPIVAGERIVAILSLRRRPEQSFTREDIALAKRLSDPLAGAMPLVERATRSSIQHILAAIRSSVAFAFSRGRPVRKLAILAALALVAWFCFGTKQYRITVPAVIRSTHTSFASAPFDGALAEVMVRPGDRVAAGDPILRMDTRDLELQRAELLAQQRAYELEVRRAADAGDAPAATTAAAQLELTRAQLDLIEKRIEQATVRASKPAVVLGPDIRQRIGEVVAVGTPLVSLADPDDLRVELLVPEKRAADLELGADIAFAPNARPESPLRSSVSTRPPATEIREGKSVLVAEAPLHETPPWLRPGMEGVARIDAGSRPVWWIALHGIIDYVNLELVGP